MHPPCDSPAPAPLNVRRRLRWMGHLRGVAVRVLLWAWVGCIAAVSIGAFAIVFWGAAGFPQLEWTETSEIELEQEAATIAVAIARERLAVERLRSRRHVNVYEVFDPISFSVSSDLDCRVAELTGGETTYARQWKVTVENLASLEEAINDLKQLRHIESIYLEFQGWTADAPARVRRLPPADHLVLKLGTIDTHAADAPDYHLIEGLPFTGVEIRLIPLTKSILRMLASLPLLNTLEMADFTNDIADETWADLRQCRTLSTLMIRSVDVTDSRMNSITGIPSLKKLALFGVSLRNRRGLSLLPASLELDELTISDCPIFGDYSLAVLSVDPVELNLFGTRVKFQGKGRDWLLSRKRLKRVTMSDRDFSASEVEQLNALGGPQFTLWSPCW